MKKKLIIDNIVYPGQVMSGISNVFYQNTKRLLADSRFDIKFVDRSDSCINHHWNLLKISNEDIIRKSKMPYLVDCFINPKLNIKEPYIFHSSYYRISRDKAAINVTTVHDFAYERVFPHNLKYFAHVYQQKYAVMHSDVIICISENTKKDLLYFYKNVDESKIHVIYNGVSDAYFRIEDRSSLNLPYTQGTYCIYVGARYHYKNFDVAVKSVARTDLNLVIVGPRLSTEEIDFLNTTLGKDRYISLTNVDDNRLNELYNGALCLLYLSSYEGFGIPCLEAQKTGCPVIAFNSSSIPEVVFDKKMLANTLDEDYISNMIEGIKDVEYRKKIETAGMEFAKSFSWDRCYKELSDLYSKLL